MASTDPKKPGNDAFCLTTDCFVIDPTEVLPAVHLAYFPLASIVLRINADAAALLHRLKAGPIRDVTADEASFLSQLAAAGLVNGEPLQPPRRTRPAAPRPVRTILLTSARCNLRCVYCYGSAETRGPLMSMDMARGAIDLLIANARHQKRREIVLSFHGGGEPTVNWPVLQTIVEEAQAHCEADGLKLRTAICTNGVVNEQQVDWLAGHMKSVVISIDGTEDLQNAQRPLASGAPSFPVVAATIDRLAHHGIRPVFRLTATARTEGRLVECYRFLTSRFSPRSICVEPLFHCGRCVESNAALPDANAFARELTLLDAEARIRKIPAVYSGGRLDFLSDRFCGAAGENFFVTPDGAVTSCVEVSSMDDARAQTFIYGRWNPTTGQFDFDLERWQQLGNLNVLSFEDCNDCLARWHCAGDCPAKAAELTRARNGYRCAVNRAIVTARLLAIAARREAPMVLQQ